MCRFRIYRSKFTHRAYRNLPLHFRYFEVFRQYFQLQLRILTSKWIELLLLIMVLYSPSIWYICHVSDKLIFGISRILLQFPNKWAEPWQTKNIFRYRSNPWYGYHGFYSFEKCENVLKYWTRTNPDAHQDWPACDKAGSLEIDTQIVKNVVAIPYFVLDKQNEQKFVMRV